MAKLTPDATRTEHGLVINEKIIPWGAVWPKDSGAYKKGAQYKADRLLSGGHGQGQGRDHPQHRRPEERGGGREQYTVRRGQTPT